MAAFSRLASQLPAPMFVVTARAGDERSGCLVGFATQCSIHPPRMLVCISVLNHTFAVARRASHLGVHVLAEGDRVMAELFGGETGDRIDKFERVAWVDGPFGVPVLVDCPRWFAGRVLDWLDLGDHHGALLAPVAVGVPTDPAGTPSYLTLPEVEDIPPGHPA